jgi:hypothetical protein
VVGGGVWSLAELDGGLSVCAGGGRKMLWLCTRVLTDCTALLLLL